VTDPRKAAPPNLCRKGGIRGGVRRDWSTLEEEQMREETRGEKGEALRPRKERGSSPVALEKKEARERSIAIVREGEMKKSLEKKD